MRRTDRRVPWGRVLAAGVAIGTSWALVRDGEAADRFDQVAAEWLRRPLGPTADVTIGAATDLGSVFGLAGTAAVLAATGRRDAAVDVAGAGAIAWVAAQSAKPMVDRPRPYEEAEAERLVTIPAGSSWPSGHSAVAAAIGTAAADHGRRGARLLGACLVLFVASSRIYVGVHHATDPLAGAGIGVLSATAWQRVRGIGRRIRRRRSRRRRR